LHYIQFNMRDRIVGDPRVRRAIAAAIDRSKIIKAATYGAALPTDSDQPAFSWAYDASLPHIAYDPTAARATLDAAGWAIGPDGIRFKQGMRLELGLVIVPEATGGSRIVGTVFQQELHEIGVDVNIKAIPESGVNSLMTSGRYQLMYSAFVGPPDPDDSWLFGCDQMPPAGFNWSFWCNERADAAMRDALSTFDVARRKRDYAIVQEQMLRDLPIFPLWEVKRPDAYTPRLHGFSTSPLGSTYWNAWSWTLQS